MHNMHHCLVELRESTPVAVIDAMATCSDGGWTPCPHMLRAAAEPLDLRTSKFDRKNATGVALSVWDALDYLLDDYSDGGDFIDDQVAFEICSYRASMVSGQLIFEQQRFSGLHKEPRLAALVELAVHLGFWIEVYN